MSPSSEVGTRTIRRSPGSLNVNGCSVVGAMVAVPTAEIDTSEAGLTAEDIMESARGVVASKVCEIEKLQEAV